MRNGTTAVGQLLGGCALSHCPKSFARIAPLQLHILFLRQKEDILLANYEHALHHLTQSASNRINEWDRNKKNITESYWPISKSNFHCHRAHTQGLRQAKFKKNIRRSYGLLLELSSPACFHLQGKIDHREDYVTESHGLMEKIKCYSSHKISSYKVQTGYKIIHINQLHSQKLYLSLHIIYLWVSGIVIKVRRKPSMSQTQSSFTKSTTTTITWFGHISPTKLRKRSS